MEDISFGSEFALAVKIQPFKVAFFVVFFLMPIFESIPGLNGLMMGIDFLNFLSDLSRFLLALEISSFDHLLGIMVYPSSFNRCYLTNHSHNILNEVIMGLSSAIKVLKIAKIYIVIVSSRVSVE